MFILVSLVLMHTWNLIIFLAQTLDFFFSSVDSPQPFFINASSEKDFVNTPSNFATVLTLIGCVLHTVYSRDFWICLEGQGLIYNNIVACDIAQYVIVKVAERCNNF